MNTMSPAKPLRQGDVLLLDREIPEGAATVARDADDRLILAYGEVSGHAHAVNGNAELFEMNGRRYLNVKEPATLIHEEHGTIDLPVGGYQVIGGQREWRESDGRQYAPIGD